jgi:fructose-specific phosphotransferase system component IIB
MRWIFALAVLFASDLALHADEPHAVSFSHDVMAVLSKAGCNMGVCHGNFNGKGGLNLSLRGADPAKDYRTLTTAWLGRRNNVLEPDRSLLLLKPTMAVAHEGGQRFAFDSIEYQLLRDWIASGMPNDRGQAAKVTRLDVTPTEAIIVDPDNQVSIRALAHFSDGSSRDVTRLAVYEPNNQLVEAAVDGTVRRVKFGETTIVVRYLDQQVPVRLAFIPHRPDFVWREPPSENVVDREIDKKLKRLTIEPSEVCDDRTFLRRASLDLLGTLPTPNEAREFLRDTDPDKRRRLIDRWLDRPEFADYWTLKWSDLLKNEEKVIDRTGVKNFHDWIRKSLVENRPFDEFVAEIISAKGSTYGNPASNYYRANRDAVSRAESTAQLFLGTRLQCAKCHNHPFEKWTQADYYNWTAVFSGVDYEILKNDRKDKNDKHEFNGEQVVKFNNKNDVKNPTTGKPASPQFLGGPATPTSPERLSALAEWLTAGENELFVRSQTNRIWYHLMGQGIVDPIDDFRSTNPPSNPELLDALSAEFVNSGFDLRHMIRTIMKSKAYQRSCETNEFNIHDETNFSHGFVRRLEAEPLLDAMCRVCDVEVEFAGYDKGIRATQLPGVKAERKRETAADAFLRTFGKPPRLISCECERSNETTLVQTFDMISGPVIDSLISSPENTLGARLASDATNDEILEHLYWSALSRSPTTEEHARVTKWLEESDDRRAVFEDVLWGLLNSKEFLLRY